MRLRFYNITIPRVEHSVIILKSFPHPLSAISLVFIGPVMVRSSLCILLVNARYDFLKIFWIRVRGADTPNELVYNNLFPILSPLFTQGCYLKDLVNDTSLVGLLA